MSREGPWQEHGTLRQSRDLRPHGFRVRASHVPSADLFFACGTGLEGWLQGCLFCLPSCFGGRKLIFEEPRATLMVRGSFPGRPLSPELQLWVTSAKQLCLVMVKLMSKAHSQMQVVTKSPTQICVHVACLTSSQVVLMLLV